MCGLAVTSPFRCSPSFDCRPRCQAFNIKAKVSTFVGKSGEFFHQSVYWHVCQLRERKSSSVSIFDRHRTSLEQVPEPAFYQVYQLRTTDVCRCWIQYFDPVGHSPQLLKEFHLQVNPGHRISSHLDRLKPRPRLCSHSPAETRWPT